MRKGTVGVKTTEDALHGDGQDSLPFLLILNVRRSFAWRTIHSQPVSFAGGVFISKNHSRKILHSRVFAKLSTLYGRSTVIDWSESEPKGLG